MATVYTLGLRQEFRDRDPVGGELIVQCVVLYGDYMVTNRFRSGIFGARLGPTATRDLWPH